MKQLVHNPTAKLRFSDAHIAHFKDGMDYVLRTFREKGRYIENKLKSMGYPIERPLPRRNNQMNPPLNEYRFEPKQTLVEPLTLLTFQPFYHSVIYAHRAELPCALGILNDVCLALGYPPYNVNCIESQDLLYTALYEYKTLRKRIFELYEQEVDTMKAEAGEALVSVHAKYRGGDVRLLVRGGVEDVHHRYSQRYPNFSFYAQEIGGYMYAEPGEGGQVLLAPDGTPLFHAEEWYQGMRGFAQFQLDVINTHRVRKLNLLVAHE